MGQEIVMSTEWLDPLFVGRERELEWLGHQMEGHGKTVIVGGKRGVGKTALLTRYLYGAEERPWVRWDLHPDPASLEGLQSEIEGLYDKKNRTEVVVIDNAELISSKTANRLVARILNLKRVRGVILVSSKRLDVRDANILILKPLEQLNKPLQEGKLYDLNHGIILPEHRIIAEVNPRIVLTHQSIADHLQHAPESVLRLTPRQFEELIADILEDLGCEVKITPATRDGGKDILAYMPTPLGRVLCLVEAKRYRHDRPVGVGLVRQLYGTLADAGASNAMMVTTSTFSKDARAFRQKHEYRLDLRDYTNVVDWIKDYGRN